MQKVVCLFVLLLGITFAASAQTATPASAPAADYYVGKWDILIEGTPMGDVKLLADLTRKEGKLTGELTSTADNTKLTIISITETADKLTINFDTTQAGEVSLELAKVDDDNMKGAIMSFTATAKRQK
jgi:hypothetical protein